MAASSSQDFRPESRPKEICKLSGRNDYASISDPGFCGRNNPHEAYNFREAYGYLKMPVVIVASTEDQVSEVQQSAELHRDIAQSTLRCISNTGHMVHQTATAEVMSAIDMVASQNKEAVSAIGVTSRQRRGHWG